ncbi:MAG: hypothetical protein HZA36_00765 [Parcubacteria group bacterium]|nr:hypothetical protein [Parcubacteria group bacterium]
MLFLFIATAETSYATEKSTPNFLNGMYLNTENLNAPGIEFKEDGTCLLYRGEDVFGYGTYEVEEGKNTLLLKLGSGQAIRFKFEQTNLSSFSHPKMGTWKRS